MKKKIPCKSSKVLNEAETSTDPPDQEPIKKSWGCKHCGKSFYSNSTMNRHIRLYCKSKKEAEKLKKLYDNTRELLKNMTEAGDLFNQYSETIGTNASNILDAADGLDETQGNLDETLYVLDALVNKIKDNTFDDIDKDNDGIITQDEFDDFIKK